jgi:aryl-alcohol dehydrogenase-like predicted oxidoreductase
MLSKWKAGAGETLRGFISSGKVRHIGVSVYSPEKALEALDIEGIDMIQVPSNILDRRFEKRRVFDLATMRGKQIYVRSVFLQGLILMDSGDLPQHMLFAMPVLDRIKALSKELGLTRHELALGYLRQRMPAAKLLIGAEIPEQVSENLLAFARAPRADIVTPIQKHFDQVDEKILNPVLWRK